MADSCAFGAIRYGAGEVKAASYRLNMVSLPNVAKVLAAKGDFYNATCSVRTTNLKRITSQIAWMCQTGRSKNSPFDNGVQEDDGSIYLTSHDDLSAVMKVASRLGYDLSEEDGAKVFEAFQRIAEKKGSKYPLTKKWFLGEFSDMEGGFDMEAAKKDIANYRIAKAQASILEVVSAAAAAEQNENEAA